MFPLEMLKRAVFISIMMFVVLKVVVDQNNAAVYIKYHLQNIKKMRQHPPPGAALQDCLTPHLQTSPLIMIVVVLVP